MDQLSLDALRSFSGVAAVDPWSTSTALVVIDMQNRLAGADGFTVAMLRARGLEEAARQYLEQMDTAVPNMRRLLDRSRAAGQPVIHVRPTRLPGRQLSNTTSDIGYREAADAWEIVEVLAPVDGEIVLDKACSGAFPGTNIDFILRRLGVRAITFLGCVTDGCVEQSLRQAHDLGYACVLVSDGTAALTREIHENAVQRLEHRRAHVRTTDQLLDTDQIPATTITIPASG